MESSKDSSTSMLPPEEHFRLIQQSLIEQLFAEFRHAALVTNSEHRIVWANAAFEAFYGYKVPAVIGLPATMLHDPELPEDTLRPVARQLLEKRLPWSGSYRNQRANGEVFNAYYFAVPLDHFPRLPVNGVFCVSCLDSDAGGLRDEVLGHVVNRCLTLAANAEADGTGRSAGNLSRKGQRQREIHRLTLLGYSSKEIAGLLGISPSTVNVVRWKLGQNTPRKGPRKRFAP
jgi:PAS domain S-box-containing protein